MADLKGGTDASYPPTPNFAIYMGRKEMFYLTTHSTHFIYGYMASDIWLRTILIVRKETRCRHIGYSYRLTGAGRSSEVERSLMVRWVVGSILHGVDPLSYFSFQPVLHDWCNKGRGMCYPVCGMVHIKEPLLLIDKSSLCGGSGFPFSLSEWSLTICLTPYNRR